MYTLVLSRSDVCCENLACCTFCVLLQLLLSHFLFAHGQRSSRNGWSNFWPKCQLRTSGLLTLEDITYYKSVWFPTVGEMLRLTMELTNPQDPLPSLWLCNGTHCKDRPSDNFLFLRTGRNISFCELTGAISATLDLA